MPIPSFDVVMQDALVRKGGLDALEADMPTPKSKQSLSRIKDDRWLSQMTKCVFQAGFSWKVIEAKWDGFEEAFEGFAPARWAAASPDDHERLLQDTRIVRNGQKIQTVPHNARYILDVAAEHGSYGKYISAWPTDDIIGLFADLKKRGSRLGGTSAQYFLRWMGKDTFIFSRSVNAALVKYGVVDKAPTGKGAQKKVQEAFNSWADETGRPLCALSRILAYSVPD